MSVVLRQCIAGFGLGGKVFSQGWLHSVLLLLMLASLSTKAAAPPVTPAGFDGQWQLLDDSDDIATLWHEGIRERMKRDARRTSSSSPMARPANPGQHINLPVFLATYKRIVFRSAPRNVIIDQQQFQMPEWRKPDRNKFIAPDAISREINLHPEATSISLRESAQRPPTMFIGGWEKDELVIETTTDEGLLIEERWHITREDGEEILHREVQLRSSIWGEKNFRQQFARAASS